MTLYNVTVTVVELIEADSEADAVARLSRIIDDHGFQVYAEGGNAFESELPNEPSEIRPSCGQVQT